MSGWATRDHPSVFASCSLIEEACVCLCEDLYISSGMLDYILQQIVGSVHLGE